MPSRVPEFLSETQDAFSRLLKRSNAPGLEAELFAVQGRSRGWEWSDGCCEQSEESQERGLGLRLLKEGRLGFAYGAGLGPNEAEALFSQALAMIAFAPREVGRVLPEPKNGPILSEN